MLSSSNSQLLPQSTNSDAEVKPAVTTSLVESKKRKASSDTDNNASTTVTFASLQQKLAAAENKIEEAQNVIMFLNKEIGKEKEKSAVLESTQKRMKSELTNVLDKNMRLGQENAKLIQSEMSLRSHEEQIVIAFQNFVNLSCMLNQGFLLPVNIMQIDNNLIGMICTPSLQTPGANQARNVDNLNQVTSFQASSNPILSFLANIGGASAAKPSVEVSSSSDMQLLVKKR